MLHIENTELSRAPNTEPVKLIPLEEDFKEDLYEIYGVYKTEFIQTNHYGELRDLY